ncbi:hypothetical protein B6J31_21955 [Klebsiella pneumoniae]|nr:hypothetical protein [Klebsiella pneumoniae]PLH38926.1 hypothetical protein B6J31_21955 [Klebsiella pneumoniae]
MTTDITELAQREKFEAWVMTQICISKSTLEGLRTIEGYRNSTLSGTDYNRLWSLYQSATAELVEALEKAQRASAAQDEHINQQQDRIEQLERGNRYAAKRISSWRRLAKQSIAEQEKCVNELDAARQRIVELDRKNSELDSLTQCWAVERAENAERIAELESRTVKLPDLRQIVSGDRYVWSDGVYNYSQDVKVALAAAGIKVEDE